MNPDGTCLVPPSKVALCRLSWGVCDVWCQPVTGAHWPFAPDLLRISARLRCHPVDLASPGQLALWGQHPLELALPMPGLPPRCELVALWEVDGMAPGVPTSYRRPRALLTIPETCPPGEGIRVQALSQTLKRNDSAGATHLRRSRLHTL